MDYDIRRLQEEELTLLDELLRVCRSNDITFYLAAGTCIGALRHKGFIPWDDDVDVFMYYDQADKLQECKDQFSEEYFLQTPETDKGYRKTIYRLRKNGTALVEKDDLDMDCHHGIYIDIYILYYYPSAKMRRINMIKDSLMYQLLLYNRPPYNHGSLVRQLGNIFLLIYANDKKRNKKICRLKNNLRKYSEEDDVAILYGMDISFRRVISYRKEWFQKPEWIEFENRLVPVATDADSYMKRRYGNDYMIIPPLEQRHSYHSFYYVSFEEEYHPLKQD